MWKVAVLLWLLATSATLGVHTDRTLQPSNAYTRQQPSSSTASSPPPEDLDYRLYFSGGRKADIEFMEEMQDMIDGFEKHQQTMSASQASSYIQQQGATTGSAPRNFPQGSGQPLPSETQIQTNQPMAPQSGQDFRFRSMRTEADSAVDGQQKFIPGIGKAFKAVGKAALGVGKVALGVAGGLAAGAAAVFGAVTKTDFMTADDTEDCVACLYIWSQVELQLGRARFETDIYDAFTKYCAEASTTEIFYPACAGMEKHVDQMIRDYMEGKMNVGQMCDRALMCRRTGVKGGAKLI